MPRLNDDMEQMRIAGRGGFAFTGVRLEKLGESAYTLVTIAVDVTGSVRGFQDELRKMLIMAVEACKKNPRSDTILVRVVLFSTSFKNGISEIHGFKPLSDIDTSQYPELHPGGWTPLCDATYSTVGATVAYGEQLGAKDYNVNGIGFVITDGAENSSTATMKMVLDIQEDVRKSEKLESFVSILVGINSAEYKAEQEAFVKEAGITHYRDAGQATPRNLAKLAGFVSQSVSSQSQALGTGGPSQNIAPTI